VFKARVETKINILSGTKVNNYIMKVRWFSTAFHSYHSFKKKLISSEVNRGAWMGTLTVPISLTHIHTVFYSNPGQGTCDPDCFFHSNCM
jgi:hypothetical protein